MQKGSYVVLIKDWSFFCEVKPCAVYQIEEVIPVEERTLLPQAYIDAGYIPDQYKPHMRKGIRTTNHDLMGSCCLVRVQGHDFSAAWFRPATPEEIAFAEGQK